MLRAKTFTLNATAQSLAELNSAGTVIHTPIKWISFQSESGNAAIAIGVAARPADLNKAAMNLVTAADFGLQIAAASVTPVTIGPFGGGECPFNLEDIRVIGTDTQKLHLLYVTL